MKFILPILLLSPSVYALNTSDAVEQQTDYIVLTATCLMFALGFVAGGQR